MRNYMTMELTGQSVPSCIEAAHHEGDLHLIREIIKAHQALMNSFSTSVGMPSSRLAVVRLLAVSGPSGLTVSAIARTLGVNLAAVTRHVQHLEVLGMALRRNDKNDQRRSYVRLSAKGLKAFNAAHARSHELERSLVSKIGLVRAKTAAEVLAQIRALLEVCGTDEQPKSEAKQ